MASGAARADQKVLADRIVDDAGDRLAILDDGQHHAEQRHARGEVEGAVDRIDDEGELGAAQARQQRGVDLAGLLADHQRARIAAGDRRGDDPLGIDVGLGDEVGGRGLLAHVARAQPPEPRHDLRCRRVGEHAAQPADVAIVKAHRHCHIPPSALERQRGEVEQPAVHQVRGPDIAERADHGVLAARHAPLDIVEHRLHGVALQSFLAAAEIAGDDRKPHAGGEFRQVGLSAIAQRPRHHHVALVVEQSSAAWRRAARHGTGS